MYVLQSLHVHPSGNQFLIFVLNSGKFIELFMDSWRSCQVFWPLNNKVSVPNPTVLTLEVSQCLLFLRLYELSFIGKRSWIRVGDNLFLTLYISAASFCKFLWCIEKDLSRTSSSWKLSSGLLYTNLRVLSWSLLILLLSCLEWNIHDNG